MDAAGGAGVVITKTLRTPRDLTDAGLHVAGVDEVVRRYAIAITPAMAGLIVGGEDGIARQFMPDARELVAVDGESADPIGDRAHSPVEGIVHRYRDRVLLKVVHVCPVYCRFCFRREMVGPDREPGLTPEALGRALDYIAGHDEIGEVIVTGGDPFILAAHRVAELTRRLAAIAHVGIVRWHTRVPVVDPARVTEGFVAALTADGVATFVAVHANHPREFTVEARLAIAAMADAGIALLSQSVLLKGVNDQIETLEELMRCFVRNRIKPYYLHHADLAPGTSHFRTTIAEGQALMRALRARVSGVAMPAYVLDIPGGFSKVNLESNDVEFLPSGRLKVRDDRGRWHDYAGA